MENGGQLLRISQAAAYLNISRTTLYRLIQAGKIHTVKVGARQRIQLAEINRYISQEEK